MSKLKNKVAVITDGSSEIGIATARHFIESGLRVVITGHNKEGLDFAVDKLGERAIGICGNFANLDNLGHLFIQIQKQFGRVDVLFTNAGIAPFVPFEIRNQ